MTGLRRLVLDLLKPHDPSSVELATAVADLEGVEGANVTLMEQDQEVEDVKLTVEGGDLDYAAVEAAVESLGATVHSIDEVVSGERMVEESKTPQD